MYDVFYRKSHQHGVSLGKALRSSHIRWMGTLTERVHHLGTFKNHRNSEVDFPCILSPSLSGVAQYNHIAVEWPLITIQFGKVM